MTCASAFIVCASPFAVWLEGNNFGAGVYTNRCLMVYSVPMTNLNDDWAEYVPAHAPRTPEAPLAILTGHGLDIGLTPQAAAMVGTDKAVKLLFDRSGKRIGLKAADPSDRNAYPLKRYGEGQLYRINFQAFRQWAQIEVTGRQVFPVSDYGEGVIGFAIGDGEPGKFEPFEYKNVVVSQLAPNVSIPASARNMTLNRAAKALLGDPVERVTLLYRASRRMIGLRPAAPTDINAMPIRQYPSTHGWAISIEAFVKSFGIVHPEGQSYEPRKEGEILIIELDKPKAKRGKQT